MTEPSFSPLAWELARRAVVRPGSAAEPGPVCAWLLVGDCVFIKAFGPTSTTATRALAVALDEWAAKREGAKA